MDYQILIDELTNDPLTRGYAGMTDQQAADDLNTTYRTKSVSTVTGSSVLNSTDDTEFTALTDANQQKWLALCGADTIDVTSGVAKSLEAALFGNGTTTRSNLLALKTQSISRATELGLETITAIYVENARNGNV